MDFLNLVPAKKVEQLNEVNNANADNNVNSSNNQDELALIFDENNPSINREKPNENDNKWEIITDIEKSFLGFINTGKHIFTTSDGTTIEVTDTSNIQVKENKETGEIVIIGADNAIIKGSNADVKISIYDSDISYIDLGKGNDNIYLENSQVDKINSGAGDDTISTSKSNVTVLNGEIGNDEINIFNDSSISVINGNSGNDDVIVENSVVKKIQTGNDDDYIYAHNSELIEVNSNNGNDNIYIESSTANKILGGDGNDNIIIENTNTVNTVNGENGYDNLKIIDSIIENLITEENDYIQKGNNTTSIDNIDIQNIDEVTQEKSLDILNEITSKYKTGELTPEEQTQILTIDFLNQNLENMKTQFEEQKKEDGAISNTYNTIKILTDLGISSKDIEAAIKEQEQMIAELNAAINGETNESFEEIFKKWTNLDYNPETILQYQEKSQPYALAMNGLYKAEEFSKSIFKAKDLNTVFNSFTEYYGSEELARKELNEYLQEAFFNEDNQYTFGFVEEIYINENNQLVVKRPKEYGMFGPLEDTEYETTIQNLSDVNNMIKAFPMCFDKTKFTHEFQNNFEETMDISIENLQKEYSSLQIEAFGKNNSFQRLIDKYCAEQKGFSDKLASVAQITGVGLMVTGGVITFVWPPAGMAMIKAGQYTAMAGMFGDNVIDLVDGLSSEKGITKDEAWEMIKETTVELALYYSGRGIGNISSGVNEKVLSATHSKVLAMLSEIGTDGTLSLLSDYIITGDLDISGEGLSQFISIITGIAGSKLNNYYQTKIQEADIIATTSSTEEAINYLKKMGVDKRLIKKFTDSRANSVDIHFGSESKILIDTNRRNEIYTPEDVNGRIDILKQQHMSSSDAKKIARNTIAYQNAILLIQSGLEPSYVKNIALLDDVGLHRFNYLTTEKGIYPYFAGQISKLEIGNYYRALDLYNKGIPESKLADTAILSNKEALRVDTLLKEGVNPYYIARLASLDDNAYRQARNLISKNGLNAASAYDIASKQGDKLKETLDELSKGKYKPKKDMTPEIEKALLDQAEKLYYADYANVNTAKDNISTILPNDKTILTARQKGIQSILNKLISKYEKGDINISPENINASCHEAIGDMLGTRIQLEAITPEKAKTIISKTLESYGVSFESFMYHMKNGTVPPEARNFKDIKKNVLNDLKTAQTQPLVDKLIKGITNGEIKITELNNYGNNITSYFTNIQLIQIADAYFDVYQKPLTIITKIDDFPKGDKFNEEKGIIENDHYIVKNKGSQKDSGYASTQMNVKHEVELNVTSNGELQIRGQILNTFADIEHIPYDIRQGKITAKDTEYKEVYHIINNMDYESYQKYNKYLTETYEWLRLQELGIETTQPEIPTDLRTKFNTTYRPEDLAKITREGLTELNAKIHS